MNINWREVPFMTIIMKWWRTVKHIVINRFIERSLYGYGEKGIPGDSIRKVYAPAKEWYGNILK